MKRIGEVLAVEGLRAEYMNALCARRTGRTYDEWRKIWHERRLALARGDEVELEWVFRYLRSDYEGLPTLALTHHQMEDWLRRYGEVPGELKLVRIKVDGGGECDAWIFELNPLEYERRTSAKRA